jgi:peptidoglycan/LPS O-acetylase OafA/YrhL
MNKHLSEFDLIRATAALAVIAIHVTAGYMSLPLGFIWNHLVRFAVPLFIIISGFLLCWTDNDLQPLSVTHFYTRRLNRILWPYLIWTLIYTLVNAWLLHQSNLWQLASVFGQNLLWGNASYHLYFIIIIIQMYALYPLLRVWHHRSGAWLLFSSLLLTGVVQIVLYLYLIHKIVLPGQYGPVYVRAFPVWIFYFVFGMYMAARMKKNSQQDLPGVSALGCLWGLSLMIMVSDSWLSAAQGSIVRPSVILYTVSSFLFFYVLARKLPWSNANWVRWLSAQSFIIYLMHPLFLMSLMLGMRWLGYPGFWDGNLGMLALYLATAALTVAASWFVSHTAIARILGGS